MNETNQLSSDVRNWAMACHLGGLGGLLIGFGWIIAPLVIWLMKRQDDPFIDAHGKESVNFQITMLIAYIVSGLLTIVVIGLLLLPVVLIVHVVFMIIASVKASSGEMYQYPICIRLIN